MFVIIEYIAGTFETVNLVSVDGEAILFGSKHTAKKYAIENCGKWTYKIVKL